MFYRSSEPTPHSDAFLTKAAGLITADSTTTVYNARYRYLYTLLSKDGLSVEDSVTLLDKLQGFVEKKPTKDALGLTPLLRAQALNAMSMFQMMMPDGELKDARMEKTLQLTEQLSQNMRGEESILGLAATATATRLNEYKENHIKPSQNEGQAYVWKSTYEMVD